MVYGGLLQGVNLPDERKDEEKDFFFSLLKETQWIQPSLFLS